MPKTILEKEKVVKRHNPLDEDILREKLAIPPKNKKKKRGVSFAKIESIDEKTTSRIINEMEEGEDNSIFKTKQKKMGNITLGNANFTDLQTYGNSNFNNGPSSFSMDQSVSELMKGNNSSENILKKINESENQKMGMFSFFSGFDETTKQKEEEENLNPKVVEVYKEVGKILRNFKSGKLPKAFNVLPSLNNWEFCLNFTKPERWSAQAVFEAVKIFKQSRKEVVERFYNIVLLPRLRKEIEKKGKLSLILFNAFRKAMFKDVSFYKGILLPICEDGSINMREATCLGSIIKKSTVRMFQASAVLMKLVRYQYTDPIMKIIKSFLEKNIALPNQVIDVLFSFFARFGEVQSKMNTVWFEGLLGFVRTYKKEFSKNQVNVLLDLCKVHRHNQITNNILFELRQALSSSFQRE